MRKTRHLFATRAQESLNQPLLRMCESGLTKCKLGLADSFLMHFSVGWHFVWRRFILKISETYRPGTLCNLFVNLGIGNFVQLLGTSKKTENNWKTRNKNKSNDKKLKTLLDPNNWSIFYSIIGNSYLKFSSYQQLPKNQMIRTKHFKNRNEFKDKMSHNYFLHKSKKQSCKKPKLWFFAQTFFW